MKLIPISFNKIMQSRAYTVIILGNEQKEFAIYTNPIVGDNLQKLLNNEPIARPYTHNLIRSIFEGLDISLNQVVIHDIEDTIYFSRLFLEQNIGDKRQILEIDARPSDSLTLALMHDAPLMCRQEVFERAVPVKG